jgi:CRP-like cAMP-binding protein
MAEACEDALVCVITRQDFMDMLRSQPDLAFKVTSTAWPTPRASSFP